MNIHDFYAIRWGEQPSVEKKTPKQIRQEKETSILWDSFNSHVADTVRFYGDNHIAGVSLTSVLLDYCARYLGTFYTTEAIQFSLLCLVNTIATGVASGSETEDTYSFGVRRGLGVFDSTTAGLSLGTQKSDLFPLTAEEVASEEQKRINAEIAALGIGAPIEEEVTLNSSPYPSDTIAGICNEAIAALNKYRSDVIGYAAYTGIASGEVDEYTRTTLFVDVDEYQAAVYSRVIAVLNNRRSPLSVGTRFEDHLVDAIATAHRDYDHWNG